MTFELDIYLFLLALARSGTMVKVISQKSRSEDKNVAEVVCATSKEGFLFIIYLFFIDYVYCNGEL